MNSQLSVRKRAVWQSREKNLSHLTETESSLISGRSHSKILVFLSEVERESAAIIQHCAGENVTVGNVVKFALSWFIFIMVIK